MLIVLTYLAGVQLLALEAQDLFLAAEQGFLVIDFIFFNIAAVTAAVGGRWKLYVICKI
jgi:hypothetical protein